MHNSPQLPALSLPPHSRGPSRIFPEPDPPANEASPEYQLFNVSVEAIDSPSLSFNSALLFNPTFLFNPTLLFTVRISRNSGSWWYITCFEYATDPTYCKLTSSRLQTAGMVSNSRGGIIRFAVRQPGVRQAGTSPNNANRPPPSPMKGSDDKNAGGPDCLVLKVGSPKLNCSLALKCCSVL